MPFYSFNFEKNKILISVTMGGGVLQTIKPGYPNSDKTINVMILITPLKNVHEKTIAHRPKQYQKQWTQKVTKTMMVKLMNILDFLKKYNLVK